jgi:PEP-CTERM motif
LVMTTEYSFNPADHANNLKFSWWQANGNAAGEGTTLGGFQVAVKQGGSWYVSSQVFNNIVNNGAGGPGVNANAELKEFTYNPAAANWLALDFNGDYTLGATPGTGTFVASTVPLVQGAAPGSALSGAITAFGLYRNTTINNSRYDTFVIETLGPPPVPGDTDSDGVVELEDFNPIRDNFRKSVAARSQGDLVQNGKVDFADFREWKAAFVGGGGSLAGVDLSFTTVPEPATVSIVLVGLLGVLGWRRSKPERTQR